MPENTDLEDEIAMICIAVVLTSPTMFFVRLIGVLVNGAWFDRLQRIFLPPLIDFVLSSTQRNITDYEECSFVFNQCSNYRFSYQDSFIATICANVDTAVTVAIVMAMACIDLTTLIKIFSYRRAMRRNATVSTDGAISEREILFFKQSCILGLLYISCTVTFNVAPHAFNDRWVLFATSTITWIMTQSLDGKAMKSMHTVGVTTLIDAKESAHILS
ncbi:hypothetical protein DINM_000352 [Dirofilaria immitis]|nr:hypothetical protein [Dirofilaria immitis]